MRKKTEIHSSATCFSTDGQLLGDIFFMCGRELEPLVPGEILSECEMDSASSVAHSGKLLLEPAGNEITE